MTLDWGKAVQGIIVALLTWNLATTQQLAVKVAVIDERVQNIMKEIER